MKTRGKSPTTAKKTLDKISEKGDRGRPRTVEPSEVLGRADHYRGILNLVWDRVWPSLSKAKTEAEVLEAMSLAAGYERRDFTANASLLLEILQEPNFPKTQKAQIKFLADSFAALGKVSPRRSRDICAKERVKAQRATYIIRYEFYVECSCGYKGRSLDHACPKCKAQIVQQDKLDTDEYLKALQFQLSSNEMKDY